MKRQSLLYLLILLLISLPYGIAWWARGDAFFSGLLFNPQDGFSYLAKMRQGWEGNWLFVLPYSAVQNTGAPIFMFYLLLGHFARITQLSLPFVFHLARILCSLFLMWSFERFLNKTLRFDQEQAFKILVLGCLGAGLGWMALFFSHISPDLWVAEAYPFLSMFANPHFPLGLGLMLLILTEIEQVHNYSRIVLKAFLGWVLSIIMPFGLAVVGVTLGIKFIWDLIGKRKPDITKYAAILIPGGLWLAYQYFVIIGDPILAQWNTQNQTPTPAWLDLLIGFSPAALLAVVGVFAILRKRESENYRLVLAWAVGCLLLAAIPFGLQRRFLTGLFIPLSILACIGIEFLITLWPGWKRFGFLVLLMVSLPSNMLTFGLFTGMGLSRNPVVFLANGEKEALDWLDHNQKGRPLCLANEKTGLILPVYTGCRVVYGHPFETVDAVNKKHAVEAFFDGSNSATENAAFLSANKVDTIILSRQASSDRPSLPEKDLSLIFENQAFAIYQVGP